MFEGPAGIDFSADIGPMPPGVVRRSAGGGS